MLNLLVWIVFGLFVGALARFVVPGRDPMGCLGTILLGIAGSVVGGFLGRLLFGGLGEGFQPAGFLGAVVGGVIVLLIWRRFRREPL
ncbi:MAG: GlsB/YeaQ/YmgE family stress response membrane protein [Rhodopirellula sp.]|nr:GlsB/YeaQ/YmgE family stress response membrane protein [Rhodopirellula sp.]